MQQQEPGPVNRDTIHTMGKYTVAEVVLLATSVTALGFAIYSLLQTLV